MNRQEKIKFLHDLRNGKTSIKKLLPAHDFDFIEESTDLYKCKQTGEIKPYSEVMRELEGRDIMSINVCNKRADEKTEADENVLPVTIMTFRGFESCEKRIKWNEGKTYDKKN